MSNWLANATGVHIGAHGSHFDRDQFGNLLKNVAPAAFLIPGVGPLAAAGIAGAGSALGRGIQHGANFGTIAKQGIQGAGEAYAGGSLLGAVRGAGAAASAVPSGGGAEGGSGLLGAGGSAGPVSYGQLQSASEGLQSLGQPALTQSAGFPSAIAGRVSAAQLPTPDISQMITNANQGGGVLSRIASGAGNLADFAEKHDKTAGAIVGAAGDELDPNARRLAAAKARIAQTTADEDEYNLNRQRMEDLANAPLRRALMGAAVPSYPVAPNPYAKVS